MQQPNVTTGSSICPAAKNPYTVLLFAAKFQYCGKQWYRVPQTVQKKQKNKNTT